MAQSINDYLKSYGVDPNERYSNKSSSSSKKTTSSSSGSSSKKNTSSSSSSKYYTTVTEKDGSTSNGYIQDGVSYYSNGTPINAGASVVDSTGKTWTKGGSDPDAGLSIDAYLSKYGVSGSSSNSYKPNYGDLSTEEVAYNPYEEQYNKLKEAYDRQEELLREQNRLAVEQGTNRLNAQKSNINQAADENARQAYVQYMQSQKALPQQLASQGVSGGATETANLGLQTAYQNNVNAINQNKANRLQEIDNAIVDLQNTGDLSTVEQVLANNQAALDAYMNTFDKGVSYNQWANTFNASRVDANRDYDAQQIQAYMDAINEQNKLLSDEKKEERDNVLKLYTGGYMSRDDAAARLGYDPEILYDTMGYLTKENELALKDKQMDINNTQSLISNRNSGGGSTRGMTGGTTISNSVANSYYNLMNNINQRFTGNSTGKGANDSVIEVNENNEYQINPNISRGSYLDPIIAEAIDAAASGAMSEQQAKEFLYSLGISESEINRVANYYIKE